MKSTPKSIEPSTPMYIKKIYPIYNSKKISDFFDKQSLLNILSFGKRKKLVQTLIREVEQSLDYIQIGVTFGDQIEKVADKVGYYGNYHIVDVSKVQIERLKSKYQGIQQNLNFSNQNGLAQIQNQYDGIICFMLLHELPPHTRKDMVNHLLNSVKERGKIIFIDYSKPKNKFFRKIFKFFNRIYNPFMEDFISKEIFELAENKDAFFWNKNLLCNELYQKVVAIKK